MQITSHFTCIGFELLIMFKFSIEVVTVHTTLESLISIWSFIESLSVGQL